MAGEWEWPKPIEQAEHALDKIELKQDYINQAEAINSEWDTDVSTEKLAGLLQRIQDDTRLTDYEKRKVYDWFVWPTHQVKETARSDRLALISDYEAKNSDIPETATAEVAIDFVNNDSLRDMLHSNLQSIDLSNVLAEWTDDTALSLHMSRRLLDHEVDREIMWDILKRVDWNNLQERVDSLRKIVMEWYSKIPSSLNLSNWEVLTDKMDEFLDKAKNFLAEKFGQEAAQKIISQNDSYYEDTDRLNHNLVYLKDIDWIDSSRFTVIEYIDSIDVNLDDENSKDYIIKLKELSWDESYNHNKEMEVFIWDLNELWEYYENFERSWKDWKPLIDALLEAEINWKDMWLRPMISSMIEKGWPLGTFFKLISNILFGPEWHKALMEVDRRRRNSLLNLVDLPKELDSIDEKKVKFGSISSWELNKFFRSMDSRNIDASEEDFWPKLFSWLDLEVDSESDNKILAVRQELWFENTWDTFDLDLFENDNKKFKDALNGLDIVKIGKEDDIPDDWPETPDDADWSWVSSELNSWTNSPVQTTFNPWTMDQDGDAANDENLNILDKAWLIFK